MPPAREAVDDRDRCGRRSPGAMPPTRNASAPSWRREAPTRSRRCGRTFLADIPCPPWRARARCHDSDGRPSANSPRGWAQSIGSRVAADLMWTRTRRGSGMPLMAGRCIAHIRGRWSRWRAAPPVADSAQSDAARAPTAAACGPSASHRSAGRRRPPVGGAAGPIPNGSPPVTDAYARAWPPRQSGRCGAIRVAGRGGGQRRSRTTGTGSVRTKGRSREAALLVAVEAAASPPAATRPRRDVVTSRRPRRRAGQRAPWAPAPTLSGGALSVAAATEGGHPLTTRRATKPQTLTNKAKEAPIHGPGSGGRDRRTAQEYAADLARETERSLRRDPERWTQRRTNEIPKDEAPSPRRHD